MKGNVKNNEQVNNAIEVFSVTWNFNPACFKSAFRNDNFIEFKKLQLFSNLVVFVLVLGVLPRKYKNFHAQPKLEL